MVIGEQERHVFYASNSTDNNIIKNELSIPEDKILFFMKPGKTEIEDLINPEIYSQYLLSKSIDISDNNFKNQSLKWSNKIERICSNVGIDFTKELEF